MFQYWLTYIKQLKERNKNKPKLVRAEHISEQTAQPSNSAIDEKEAELQRQALHQPAFTQESDADVDMMLKLSKVMDNAKTEAQDNSIDATDSDEKPSRPWSTVMTAD